MNSMKSEAEKGKETVQKRETRSRHEKKRREEMNGVLAEMMSLLPEVVQRDAFKLRRVDQKPKKPDKCFIIGNAVEFIKRQETMKKPNLLTDTLTQEVLGLTNCFLISLHNFVIAGIEGEHRSVFDLEKIRMVGKDIRCFLDFESGTKISFLSLTQPILGLRSFMAKSMTCRVKHGLENPTEMTLICIPDAPIVPALSVPAPSPPPSKMEVERPILAAMLRRKDPPPAEISRKRREELEERALRIEMEKRKKRDRHVITSQAHTAPITSASMMHSSSASTSSCSFLSPSSGGAASLVHPPKSSSAKRASTSASKGPGSRKRLRAMNVIVESFPLDESDGKTTEKSLKIDKGASFCSTATTTTTTSTLTSLLPSNTASFLNPIVSSSTIGLSPYDVLAPGYRDIWLRLQSERLLLEERIVAKEGELKNLMLTARTVPPYFPPPTLLAIPQYTIPQSTIDMITAQQP
ncbi:unnamed protein product [Caenorhabditis sp. 36 PRJEB53466]|nr:unnamed protein product [Caenorhabditis sp. 36 PRJEB53466]